MPQEKYAYPRLKDLAVHERPQERLSRLGAGALSDTELLAMMLRSGTAKWDVLALSAHLIRTAGSLHQVVRMSKEDFMGVDGIGEVKALQLVAIMEVARRVIQAERVEQPLLDTAEKVYEDLQPVLTGLDVEKFLVLCLNRKNRLIKRVEATSGTASSSLVHPREVFREAIRSGASSVIVAHNHPSGDPAPSAADIRVTRQLREAAAIIGIELLDHLIVGEVGADPREVGYYSFQESGLL